MVSYVMDTSNWEDWQRDYRFGLLLILPPEEVSEKIDRLPAKLAFYFNGSLRTKDVYGIAARSSTLIL